MTTLVNIDITLAKLESEITGAANYATVKTGLLRMAMQAIQQQRAEIEALRKRESSDTVAYVADVPVSRKQAAALGVSAVALGEVQGE